MIPATVQAQHALSHHQVREEFIEAFGPPCRSLGRDEHWMLKPTSKAVAIHVLVNGSPEMPAVWVFDAHDRMDPVLCAFITDAERINLVIRQIQERVACASRSVFQTPHARTRR